MVADVVAAYPDGIPRDRIAALLELNTIQVRYAETKGLAKLEELLGKDRAEVSHEGA